MTFSGRAALVTGGTGGLGRAVSLAFQKGYMGFTLRQSFRWESLKTP